MCSCCYFESKYRWKKIILRAAKFVGSKIMLILAINLIYSKFGEIFHSVSRLPGYESVVKGEAHYTGQKVRHFSGTNLGDTQFHKFQQTKKSVLAKSCIATFVKNVYFRKVHKSFK